MIKCKHCDWKQLNYPNGPISEKLKEWDQYLTGEKHHMLDEKINNNLTYRDLILKVYDNYIDQIKNLKYFTEEQYIKDLNAKCPKCSKKLKGV